MSRVLNLTNLPRGERQPLSHTRPPAAARGGVPSTGQRPKVPGDPVAGASTLGARTDDQRRAGTMRYYVNIAPSESRGVVLTIEAIPRLLIFGDTPEDALHHAREAIGCQLRDTPLFELVLREPDSS